MRDHMVSPAKPQLIVRTRIKPGITHFSRSSEVTESAQLAPMLAPAALRLRTEEDRQASAAI